MAATLKLKQKKVAVETRIQVIEIQADAAHPNKLKFKGVLVPLDVPSTKPPHGSQGHKILVPSDVAGKKLDTLIGMGVNYSPNLASHAVENKVGVIEKAWIKDSNLWISGHVWAGDFPDAAKVLAQKDMGMSMELTQVLVENRNAPVWTLTDFYFTGATFLRKSNAAYFDTLAIAAAADDSTTLFLQMEAEMPNENKDKVVLTPEQQEIASVAASAAAASISTALGVPLANIAAALEKSTEAQTKSNELMATLNEKLEASDDDDDDMDAGGKGKGGKSDDDDEDDDEWDGDDDDVDASLGKGGKGGDGDKDAAQAGNMNKDSGENGNTSKLKTKQGEVKASAKWKGRALKVKAENDSLKAENERLKASQVTKTDSVRASAGEAVRATLSSESMQLLAKNGVDPVDIKASGSQMDAATVDAMFASMSNPLEPEQRMEIKMNLKAAGIMKDPAQK